MTIGLQFLVTIHPLDVYSRTDQGPWSLTKSGNELIPIRLFHLC